MLSDIETISTCSLFQKEEMELERLYREFVSQLEEVNFWLHKAEETIIRSDKMSPEKQTAEAEIHKFKVGHFFILILAILKCSWWGWNYSQLISLWENDSLQNV